MSDEEPGPARPGPHGGPERRQAIVRSRPLPSIVWLIPAVAALVGLYLAYWSYTQQGPTIEITFDSAEGLEAGQTKIKYKAVDVGVVESIDISDDLSGVVVTASLSPGTARYLRESTRFWVVRAELSAGQVTGLGTFFSGVYIAMEPSEEGDRQRSFVGLDKAPVVTSFDEGTIFRLRAEDLGSIDVGSPVYYRWLRVGRVAGYALEESGTSVSLQVFVEAPHDQRVRTTTRFWNASGLDAVVSAEGLAVDTPSLASLVIGGIAFETPNSFDVAKDVPEDMVFELYPNKQATRQIRYSYKERYVLYFEESLAGLVPGSRVEFRGIKIGEVDEVKIGLDAETNEIETPVVIEVEVERLGLDPEQAEDGVRPRYRLTDLVERGFRARLKTANLATGRKAIEFAFVEGAEPAQIELGGRYPELPTAPGDLSALAASVTHILGRLEDVPIESIGENLDASLAELSTTLVEIRNLAGTANADLAPRLASSLDGLGATLSSVDATISPDSPTGREIERLISDLAQAARSLRALAERLEQHPEELLQGKSP